MNWITEAREAHQAAAVPLVEQLRSVPCDAVLRIETPNALGCMDTRSIPVGRICHEAAAALAGDGSGQNQVSSMDADRGGERSDGGAADEARNGGER